MKLLIVDDEPDLRDLIAFAVESKLNVSTVVAQSGEEAIAMLGKDRQITGVISDYHMLNGSGGDLYVYISKEMPHLPFVLCTAYQIEELPEFQGKKLAGSITKPFRWEDLIEVIRTAFLKNAAAPSSTNEREYFPVKLKSLARANILNCDIYIKLAEDKYVMLVKKGDTFTDSDLNNYSARNIEYCYLKRKDCDTFLSKLSTDIITLSLAKELPWTSSCEAMQGAYDGVFETIQRFGFTAEAQELAKAGAKLAIKSIIHLPRLSELFLKADISQFRYSHSALLAQISCLIASAVGWTSEATQYKLSLASFLHDMSIRDDELATFELNFNSKAKYEGAEADKFKRFRKHPDETATLVKDLKEIPPEVGDMIMQHHERPDGTGIPLGLNADQLGPLSSLFIVAQDVVYFIWQKEGRATFADFLKAHQSEYTATNFAKVAAALATL